MDEDEAHAIFAEAMAASGFAIDSKPKTKSMTKKSSSSSQRRRSRPTSPAARKTEIPSPNRRWAEAEKEWKLATQEGLDGDDSDDDDDDDDDSLFDDLKSVGSKKSVGSRSSRQFLVEKEDGVTSDDEEEDMDTIHANHIRTPQQQVNMMRPPIPAVSPGSAEKRIMYNSALEKSGNHVMYLSSKHSDSESTVATSNTKNIIVPQKKRVNRGATSAVNKGAMDKAGTSGASPSPPVSFSPQNQTPSLSKPQRQNGASSSPPVSFTQHSQTPSNTKQKSHKENVLKTPPAMHASSSRNEYVSSSSFRSPQPMQQRSLIGTSASSSRVKISSVSPQVATSTPLSTASDNAQKNSSDENWANFDHAFDSNDNSSNASESDSDDKAGIASRAKQVVAPQSKSPLSVPQEISKATTPTLMLDTSTESQSNDNIRIENDEGKEPEERGSEQIIDRKSSSQQYESEEYDDYSLAETISTFGTDAPNFHANSCVTSLNPIPENDEQMCNANANPLTWMMNYVGLTESDAEVAKKSKSSQESIQGFNPQGPADQTFSSLQPTINGNAESDDSFQAWLGYAADLLFPPITSCNGSGMPGQTEIPEHQAAGLLELAQCAARAAHETEGVVYNEHEIDVCKDIHFNVIRISLPLGILFQENEAGCWVARIFSSGNAAKLTSKNRVIVGDQLAAVDGKSAITKTTEEISVMISGGGESTKSEVELTFLRYIGPIRPVRDEEPKSKTPSSVPAPKPSLTMVVSTTPDESEEAGQELVIASNREIKISKRLSKKSPEKTTGLEEKHPAPILVSPKAQKSRNPFARIFKRNKSKNKQFTA